jgi:hypothetical protein
VRIGFGGRRRALEQRVEGPFDESTMVRVGEFSDAVGQPPAIDAFVARDRRRLAFEQRPFAQGRRLRADFAAHAFDERIAFSTVGCSLTICAGQRAMAEAAADSGDCSAARNAAPIGMMP